MKKIVNELIPTESYIAMTLWPVIFIQKLNERLFDNTAENHENIHGCQQLEMLVVGIVLAIGFYFVIGLWSLFFLPIFFWLYLLEYVIRILIYWDADEAYRNISTEQEAYDHEAEVGYLHVRKHFAWMRYMFKKSYERV